jgi:putative aldouronate transport system permease protein
MIGLVYSLFNFTPFKQEFIGFDNFIDLFTGIKSYNFWRAVRNTLTLSIVNLLIATVVSVIVALLLNELIFKKFKSFTQTILYLPHFMSWIVAASIFTIIFSPNQGFINNFRLLLGMEPIYFLAEEWWWTPLYHFITRWKETGWGTIIYLAALSGINPELYEAARIDGANRLQQTFYITLPGISTTIFIVFILNLGRIMNIFTRCLLCRMIMYGKYLMSSRLLHIVLEYETLNTAWGQQLVFSVLLSV